jgi:hypothetical protein
LLNTWIVSKWAVINNAAMNIHVKVFGYMFLLLLSRYVNVELQAV